jgi:hypothetical protein
MDFVKKHYEKILLGIVLLGLVGALGFLPFWIRHDQAGLEKTRQTMTSPAVQPLPPLDLTEQSDAIQRLQSPYKLNFETTNRLFNPVEWQKRRDGTFIKIESGREVGPQAVEITRTSPLYFILTLDSVETNESGARYIIGVERQAVASLWQRTKRQHYATVGEKNDAFTITAAKGPPDNPTQLVLRLTDTGESAALSKDKPFRRVDGYKADLKYSPEGKNWQDQRANDKLKFAGDDYIIVAISENEVIISAKSNQKKTTLTYNPQRVE